MTPRPKRSITTAPKPETPTQIHALKSKTLGPYPLPESSRLTCRKARYPTTANPAAKINAGVFMWITLVREWGALVFVMGGQAAACVRVLIMQKAKENSVEDAQPVSHFHRNASPGGRCFAGEAST